MTTVDKRLIEPSFWHQPLAQRMVEFADIRERDPFVPVEFLNPVSEQTERFYAVTRYDEVVEISRRPHDFCSGQGAVSIPDMPEAMLDFFGSFINMDDPRHARQRGIVARSFTPRQLQGVLDSVETICTEVIDGFCERGEVDLVEALSQPYPLLIICDMMGIPRSEFDTVLDATNIILGGGDPEYMGEGDPMATLLGAAMELVAAHARRSSSNARPTRPTISRPAWFTTTCGEDLLTPEEVASFFILLAVAGNDTTRTAISHGMNLLSQNPDQRAIWQADVAGVTDTAVEEIVRVASPVTFMRRTATGDHTVSGHRLHRGRQGGAVLRRRQPRPARSSTSPSASTCAATPTPRGLRWPRALTSAWAPTWPGASCRSCSASSSPVCPTSR